MILYNTALTVDISILKNNLIAINFHSDILAPIVQFFLINEIGRRVISKVLKNDYSIFYTICLERFLNQILPDPNLLMTLLQRLNAVSTLQIQDCLIFSTLDPDMNF